LGHVVRKLRNESASQCHTLPTTTKAKAKTMPARFTCYGTGYVGGQPDNVLSIALVLRFQGNKLHAQVSKTVQLESCLASLIRARSQKFWESLLERLET
jgi:hypothetical protein